MSTNKFLFIAIIFITPLMAISSNSWVMLWILLEMSSMAFIMSMIKSNENFSKENSMKYFLVQATASTIMLMAFLSQEFNLSSTNIMILLTPSLIISIAMSIKLAAAPFHTWMPSLGKTMNWEMLALMATWQKLIPMFIMMKNNPWTMLMFVAISSILIGTISQFNMNSSKLIITLSSVMNMGWMIIVMKINSNIPIIYLMIYMIISIPTMMLFKKINLKNLTQQTSQKMKLTLSMLILSMAGIPPLLGFLPKWMVISNISQKMKSVSILSVMIIMSTINFFIYIRLTSSPLMNQNNNSLIKHNKMFYFKMMTFMNLITPITIIFYPK